MGHFSAPLHTVKDPDPYKYQVRMWAFSNTIHQWIGSWAFVGWMCPTFFNPPSKSNMKKWPYPTRLLRNLEPLGGGTWALARDYIFWYSLKRSISESVQRALPCVIVSDVYNDPSSHVIMQYIICDVPVHVLIDTLSIKKSLNGPGDSLFTVLHSKLLAE